MNMKIRIMSLILAVLMLALAFSACGENKEEKTSEPVTEAETAAETEAATEAGVSAKTLEKIGKIFEETFADNDFKGGAYLVYKGEAVYSGGAGKADKKADIDNGADVVYHIASVTKQFTAAAILRLCEQGKMSVSDTLSKYFPEYDTGAEITVHQLLTMQSGIPDYVRQYDENGYELETYAEITLDGIEEDNSAQENREAIRKWIFSQELLFEPGERFSYCNSNYFLLGDIIEQVSGADYHSYIKTNFFEPLEMDTAGFMDDYDIKGAKVARGYHNIGSASEIIGYNGAAFACGDIMASPTDLYKWTIALHSGKVLGDEMYREMTKIQVPGDVGYSSYGYGLMINDGFYFHSGSLPCFLSIVMYSPQYDVYLALMSNYASETINTAAKDALKRIMSETDLFPPVFGF